MRISARCDYACRALLELSLHWPSKDPLHIQYISKNQEIPRKYLVHILLQLKRLGLVTSLRGKSGGYILARPPQKIRLGQIIRSISGPLVPIVESALNKDSVFVGIWEEAGDAMAHILDSVSFADICIRLKNKDRVVAYQI